MTSSAKGLVALTLAAIPATLVLGVAAGFFAGDVLPSLRTPLGERCLETALALVGLAAFTTLGVLFSRRPNWHSWLPPVMLLLALVDLRHIPNPHPIGLGLVATTWLLSLLLRPAHLVRHRIASLVLCAASAGVLHVVPLMR